MYDSAMGQVKNHFEEWEIAFAFYDWERKGGPAGPTEHPFLNLWIWWISQES
jgi:hypothetical protein